VLHGFNLRWHRLVRTARALVREGRLGSVQAIGTTYSYPLPGVAVPDWRAYRAQGGGVLFEEAVHYIDLWRYLLDDEVAEVFARISARGGRDETAVITARMRSGTLAVALLTNAAGVRNEITLDGTLGTLRVDCFRSDGLELGSATELPGAPRTRLRRATGQARQLLRNFGELRRGGVFGQSYEVEWRHFVDVVQSRETPECTLEDGRRALAVVLAAIEADTRGAPVLLGTGTHA
jgi:predicted dehydrogenase